MIGLAFFWGKRHSPRKGEWRPWRSQCAGVRCLAEQASVTAQTLLRGKGRARHRPAERIPDVAPSVAEVPEPSGYKRDAVAVGHR